MSDSEEDTVAAEVNSDVEREINEKRYARKRTSSKLKAQRERRAAMRAELRSEGAQRSKAPTAALRLKHVFGYRGYDSHNNVCVTPGGALVYHVAAVGIIQDAPDAAQRFYVAHTDDILCLGVHPTENLVATGQIGKSAVVHVWDAGTASTCAVLEGAHTVGVCATDFSADGKLLVTLGLDNYHTIVVWNWHKGEKLADTRGHQDRLFDCIFNPFDQTQLVSVGVKHIKFWQMQGAGLSGKRGIFGKVAPIESMFCAAFAHEGKTCVTGSSSGGIYVWQDRHLQRVLTAHKGPVFALCALQVGFMSGGKDGTVRLWDEAFEKCLKKYTIDAEHGDAQVGEALKAGRPMVRAVCMMDKQIVLGTKQAHVLMLNRQGNITMLNQGHCEGEVWGLAMHPSACECVTVSDDGYIRWWAFGERMHMNRQHGLTAGAARCVAISDDAEHIAVGYKNGCTAIVYVSVSYQLGSVQVLDAATFDVQHEISHRQEEISDIKFSPGESALLAVASHDNFVDIYDAGSGKRLGICKAASSYITHVDWSVDANLLCVNTGDSEQLYFKAPSGAHQNQMEPISAERDVEWATRTRVLGPYLRGIWPACSDVTDVNAAHVYQDGHIVATGDDLGFVRLFAYESKAKYAKSKSYMAHSAHVTNVRFSHDGNWLCSVGGADTALAVWALEQQTQAGHSDSPDTDSQEEGM